MLRPELLGCCQITVARIVRVLRRERAAVHREEDNLVGVVLVRHPDGLNVVDGARGPRDDAI